MVKVFMAEAPPAAGDERLHAAIAKLAALRMAGLDPRKVGLFAADVYRLVLRECARTIDDIARLQPAP